MKGTLVQWSSSIILSIAAGLASFAIVWPSYAIPMLKSDQSPLGFRITDHEANIIGSLPMIGSLIATLLTGYVSEAFGRKKTQILCGLINLVAWSLIVTAHTTIQIMIGRFFNGLTLGMSVVSVLIYTSEISELSNRGGCTSITMLLYNIGTLNSYLEGWFFRYHMICYISLTSTIVYIILMCFLKDSPPYLLRSGQEKEALEALKFYRGVSETTKAVIDELAYLKHQINPGVVIEGSDAEPILEKEKTSIQTITESKNKRSPWVLLVKVDYNRRAIITTVMFMMLSVSMGMVAVQTYANQFFAEAVPNLSPDLCSVLLALVFIVSNFINSICADLVSRRVLMISTCSVASVCLAILGAGMRWPGVPVWVSPLAIVIFCIAYQLGVINVILIQMSESFGSQVKSAATSIALCSMFGSNFLVLYLFGPVVAHIGIDGTFFIFALNAAIATVLAIIFIKETRRVKLEEVQKMYSKGFLWRPLS